MAGLLTNKEATMAFFQNFRDALQAYIADSVSLSIVDVVSPAPGTNINVGEVCRFQARVNNGGELNMTDVSLEIKGLNGTKVGTSNSGPWESSITVNSIAVPARSLKDTPDLFFKAPSVEKPASTTLVNVHVKDWKGDLTSLLVNRTSEEPAIFGHYMGQVHPS
jgi:hypothetical protein